MYVITGVLHDRGRNVMAHKIFVSYKYADSLVYQDPDLKNNPDICGEDKVLTPRHYLNAMSSILSDEAIEKWEPDGEDLSQFTDDTIASKLRDLIYDSSITIVLISPGMKDKDKSEKDQWIPWEISYSLREQTRNERTSKPNALIAVVLPDRNHSYKYCIEKEPCGAELLKFSDSFCFDIIGRNFFNKKEPDCYICSVCNERHYRGYKNSYIVYARWFDFKSNPALYIDRALDNWENIDLFDIHKEV